MAVLKTPDFQTLFDEAYLRREGIDPASERGKSRLYTWGKRAESIANGHKGNPEPLMEAAMSEIFPIQQRCARIAVQWQIELEVK